MILDLRKIEQKINSNFRDFFESKHRFCLSYGGAGSGKSFSASQKILIRILKTFETNNPHFIFVFRKFFVSNRKSTFLLFKTIITEWNLKSICELNLAELKIQFSNGSTIFFAGCDSRERLKSIAKCSSIWIEEASELQEEDFIQINLRMRGRFKMYKQVILTFNPISKFNWIYKRFFLNPKDSSTFIKKSTYLDNLFIDKQYKYELNRLKKIDSNYHRIYALGEWGQLTGVIYNKYNLYGKLPKTPDCVTFGIDFGFNNPTAIIKCSSIDTELFFEEILYAKKITNFDLINFLRKNEIVQKIFCDSAEPQRIEELVRSGFWAIGVEKGKDSVKTGINFLKQKKLHFHEKSDNLMNEVALYQWSQKDGNFIDQPVKIRDHLMDAMRYAVNNGKKEKDFLVF